MANLIGRQRRRRCRTISAPSPQNSRELPNVSCMLELDDSASTSASMNSLDAPVSLASRASESSSLRPTLGRRRRHRGRRVSRGGCRGGAEPEPGLPRDGSMLSMLSPRSRSRSSLPYATTLVHACLCAAVVLVACSDHVAAFTPDPSRYASSSSAASAGAAGRSPAGSSLGLDAVRKRQLGSIPYDKIAQIKAGPEQRRIRQKRLQKKQEQLLHNVPNPVMDSFSKKSVSHFEIMVNEDASLLVNNNGNDNNGNTIEENYNQPLPENEEAKNRKTAVDQRIDDLLNHDDDATDDEEDASTEAANEVADKRTYGQMSDMARGMASGVMARLYVSAASSGPSKSTDGKVVSKKKRVTATVQETGRDTIKSYTKSFTNHELLSREAEAALGREIQQLVKWEESRMLLEEELLRAPTYAQWAEAVGTSVPDLKKQIRKSQRAKAALVEANLRLVVTSARQTVKKSRSESNFHDACQDGIVGLARACEKFDPDKEFRFSTYALWWIKGEIHKSVNSQASPIRLPRSARKKINEIRINERVLMAEKGRKPTDEEVAERSNLSLKQLAFYRRSAQEVVSIDQRLTAKVGKGSTASGDSAKKKETQVGDLVKDAGPSPEELASKQMLKDDVRRLVKTLSPKEQVVIRMRFGLDDGEPRTLEDIAKKFKVKKYQIKKLETRALTKLRQPNRSQSVEGYASDL